MSGMPPERVLVASDLSDRAEAAVRRGIQLAAEHGSRVTLLHVIPPGLNAELDAFVHSRLRAQAEPYAGDVPIEFVVRHGKVVPTIMAETADLVVVGAHGAHWLADTFLGGIPANLVRSSRVPVLVVRKPAEDAYRTVVLAVDTSPAGAAIVRTGYALTPQADHVILHTTVVVGEHLLWMHGIPEAELAQLRDASTAEVRSHIEHLAAEVPSARVIIESGRPQLKVPEVSDRLAADLVVVGAGTASPLGHVLLGSVTQHVLRRARSDVLIVP